jgi:hypothetical protein
MAIGVGFCDWSTNDACKGTSFRDGLFRRDIFARAAGSWCSGVLTKTNYCRLLGCETNKCP